MVREHAIRGLRRVGTVDVHVLERALGDDDPRVRLSAIAAVGDASSRPTLVSRLRELAKDADPGVAAAACVALLSGPSRREATYGLDLGRSITFLDTLRASGAGYLAAIEHLFDQVSGRIRSLANCQAEAAAVSRMSSADSRTSWRWIACDNEPLVRFA